MSTSLVAKFLMGGGGGTFCYHKEIMFLRIINTHGHEPWQKSAVSIAGSCCFINNFKTNCHRHIYMVSIPTFSWSRIKMGYK